jgi:hypothetical protein
VTLPLKTAQPGPFTVQVQPFGGAPPESVSLRAYAQAGHLDTFALHSGDVTGVLTGARLDEVARLTMDKVIFAPGSLTTSNGVDALDLAAPDKDVVAQLKAGDTVTAKVALKDGRTLDLDVKMEPPRPDAILIGVDARPAQAPSDNAIALADADEVPAGSTLVFSIRAQTPAAFQGNEKVEVAPADGVGGAVLTFSSGLVLQDAQVALATLDTSKAFTASTFGPLRFRVIEDGVAGDWRPLATLVRLPVISKLRCPAGPDPSCQLTGADLFLIDSLSTDPNFAHATEVPEGFTGDILRVPHPVSGRLYVKLRDDPTPVNLAVLSDGGIAPGSRPKASLPTAVSAAAFSANGPKAPMVAEVSHP